MKREDAMADYVNNRRQYVSEIRDSFETAGDIAYPGRNVKQEYGQPGYLWMKVRFGIALCVFAGFLFLKFKGESFLGYNAEEIIDMISDNHYYTNLRELINREDSIL